MALLITLVALMVVHGLFVAAEYAIVKAAYADKLAERPGSRSNRSWTIFRQLEDYLTMCQLAKTIALLSMGLLLGLLLSKASVGSTVAQLGWQQIAWYTL